MRTLGEEDNNKTMALKVFISLSIILVLTGPIFKAEGTEVMVGWYGQIGEPGKLSGYAAYGTTLMLPYNGGFNPPQIGKYLNAAQTAGIKVWVDLRIEQTPLSEAGWKDIITTYKNHPALQGWYISDEPEYGGTSAATVQQYYNWTRAVDPDHPVAIAHAWQPHAEYVNGYDVLMIDVYPGWGYGAPDYNEFNSRVRDSYSRWKTGKDFCQQHNKGFVPVGLGFGQADLGNGVRDLSYNEYRWHTFSAVVLGIDGFLFWWDQYPSSTVRSRVEQMITQVNSISTQMANGITNDPAVTVSQPATKIIYRHGTKGNQHVILSVNISRYDAGDNNGEALTSVRFTLPVGIQTSQVEVLNENRTLPVIGGAFTDNFNPFEVHAYRFTTAGGDNTPPTPPSGLKVR